MTGGQDWAQTQIESTGEKLTIEERTWRAIRHCRRQIQRFQRMLELLENGSAMEADNENQTAAERR